MLLNIADGSGAEGAGVRIEVGNGTAAQCFTFTYISDGCYSIVSYASGLALTASDASVYQSAWTGAASQLWTIVDRGDGSFSIVCCGGGRYLDVSGASTTAGTQVCAFTPTNGKNQAFVLTAFSPEHAVADGSYAIGTAMSSSLSLDVAGETSTDGASICLWPTTGAGTQVFDVVYGGNGYYTITDDATGKVLDVSGSATTPGTPVIAYRSQGSANQQWAITSAGDGTYVITSRTATLALDVSGASVDPGAALEIWTYHGGVNQRFTFRAASAPVGALDDGIYTIASALTTSSGEVVGAQLLLDVAGYSSANGAALELWTSTGGNNQKFQITGLGGGCYLIEAVSSLKALDVKGGGTKDGTPVIQYSTHGGMNQRWLIADSGKTDSAGNRLYAIISAGCGLALSASGGTGGDGMTARGTTIDVETCSSADAQLFTITPTELTAAVADGTYTVASALDTHKALDIAGNSSADGANVDIYTYSYARNQRFTFTHVGEDYYTIVACSSGLALTSSGTSAGSNVCQATLTGAQSQLWRADLNADGSYTFVNKASRLVLDIEGGMATAGANVDVWSPNDGANQSFTLEVSRSIEDGVYTISSALDSSFAVDIAGGSKADGTAAELYTYHNGRNQRYHIVPLGNGYYKLLSLNSGTGALSVAGTSATDGDKVVQRTYSGASGQQWLIKDAGDGYYTFISALGDVSLDVAGGIATNDASLIIGVTSGATSQRFSINKVPSSNGVIVIDAGHQARGNYSLEPVGPGSSTLKYRVSEGAEGSFTHVHEYEVNLEVALKLQADLEAQGFTVYMIRTTNDVDISNSQRALMANSYHADLTIRIHCDSSNNSSIRGFLTLYPGLSQYTSGISAESYKAACIMHPIIISEMGAKDRGIVANTNLTGFNWSTVPTVLFELGMMSNYYDDYNLVNDSYQQRMAAAICDATVAYMQQR